MRMLKPNIKTKYILVTFWEKRLDVRFSDDQEVWYGFDENKEVLNIDKIKEHV